MSAAKNGPPPGIKKLKKQLADERRLHGDAAREVVRLSKKCEELESQLQSERERQDAELSKKIKTKAKNLCNGHKERIKSLTAELTKERAKNAQQDNDLEAEKKKLEAIAKSLSTLTHELTNERVKKAMIGMQLKDVKDMHEDIMKSLRADCEKMKLDLNAERFKCLGLELQMKLLSDKSKMYSELDSERAKCADLERQVTSLSYEASSETILDSCKCFFEPSYHIDFRRKSDVGKSFVRGGVSYIRPIGAMRYALAVLDRYDDDDWLKKGNGGWAVAYHGTTRENAAAIIRNGFHIGKGQRFSFGKGIYCTPDPNTASSYATQFTENGKQCHAILQVRVKPSHYTLVRQKDTSYGDFWLVADPADIRPYGLCVFGL